jgi:hypothetical protein
VIENSPAIFSGISRHPTSIDTNTTMLQTTAEAVKGVTVRRKYVM